MSPIEPPALLASRVVIIHGGKMGGGETLTLSAVSCGREAAVCRGGLSGRAITISTIGASQITRGERSLPVALNGESGARVVARGGLSTSGV